MTKGVFIHRRHPKRVVSTQITEFGSHDPMQRAVTTKWHRGRQID